MDIKDIQSLAQQDMTSVNDLIYSQLQSDVALINQLGIYIVNAGGKRMRPMLTVLAAQALNHNNTDTLADEHCTIAAIIEFIHTATLLHDDVVDGTLFNHQTFQPSERHAEQRQAVSKQPRAHAENLWTP